MDNLALYRGKNDFIENLEFRSPTLNDICDFGEHKFFSVASLICATPYDFMVELDADGIRYEDVSEYNFFITSLFNAFSSEDIQILFPNLFPERMQLLAKDDTNELVRVDFENDIIIDGKVYLQMVALIRKMCGFKHEPKFAGDELTRKKMIEIARIRKKRAKTKTNNESTLLPLISSMVNCADFKYNHKDVWDMPFFAFMDSVRRVQAVRTANQMTTGGYFGIQLSDVKDYIDWMRPL